MLLYCEQDAFEVVFDDRVRRTDAFSGPEHWVTMHTNVFIRETDVPTRTARNGVLQTHPRLVFSLMFYSFTVYHALGGGMMKTYKVGRIHHTFSVRRCGSALIVWRCHVLTRTSGFSLNWARVILLSNTIMSKNVLLSLHLIYTEASIAKLNTNDLYKHVHETSNQLGFLTPVRAHVKKINHRTILIEHVSCSPKVSFKYDCCCLTSNNTLTRGLRKWT